MACPKHSLVAGGLVALTICLSSQAMAGSDEEQLARMKDPEQWPAPGRDFGLNSPQLVVRHNRRQREPVADDLAAGHQRFARP